MKIFDKGELKILWPFYLEYFIASILYFWPAFFVIYFSDLGLSFSQIGILLAVIPLTSLVFEIPTGAFADIYGRRASVLLGYLIEGICVLSFFFAKTYYSFIGIAALWGIGMTFSSGSKDAWIVDMVNRKNKKLIHNFFNKMQVFISGGLAVSGVIGAFLVACYGVEVIWIVAAVSYLSSISILLIFTDEKHKEEKTHIKGSVKKLYLQSRETMSYGYRHHVLFYYLAATFILMIAGSLIMQITWTSFLKGLGFPDSYFGYLWTIMALFSLLGLLASSKLLTKGKEKQFIIISKILTMVVAILVAFVSSWVFALIVLALFTFLIDMSSPAWQVYFHRFIPSKMRATMGSVRSMVISIGGIIGSVVTGYLVDLIGAKYTMLLYIPVAIPAIVFYLLIKDKGGGR